MALFKVEICGVNTSKLPLLSEKKKKRTVSGDKKRQHGGKRRIYSGKSATGT